MKLMKRKLVALQASLAVACALCAVTAGGALAAPEWYVPKAPEWQQGKAGLAEASATKWKGTITIVDKGWGNATAECETTGEGSAGPGAVDKETSWTFANCHMVQNGECAKLENVKVLGLPWSTELVYAGDTVHDVIRAEGNSQPGFQMTCAVPFLKGITDRCTAPTLETSTANVAGGVNVALVGGGVKCSTGGNLREGSLSGTQLVEATKGVALEANSGAFAKVASSVADTATGTLTLEDRGFSNAGLRCSVETSGTLEPAGGGTISSYHTTGCVPVGACSKLNGEALPVHLPWHTELYASGAQIRDRIVSGGAGTPEFRFECEIAGVRRVDTCGLNTTAGIFNLSLGLVEMLFNEESEQVVCSTNSLKKEGVWRGAPRIAPAPSVGAVEARL
jgi:hypothetical protein